MCQCERTDRARPAALIRVDCTDPLALACSVCDWMPADCWPEPVDREAAVHGHRALAPEASGGVRVV
ncbi:MAG: hypothetical protein ACRDYA_13700 [Egibacteraceae bacterium]